MILFGKPPPLFSAVPFFWQKNISAAIAGEVIE